MTKFQMVLIGFTVLLSSKGVLANTLMPGKATVLPSKGMPTILSKPISPGAGMGEAVGIILNNLNLASLGKCNRKIEKETVTSITKAQSTIKKVTKFNLIINRDTCVANVIPFRKNEIILGGGYIITPIELLPLSALTSITGKMYFIFPKKNNVITGEYFKLEGVTKEMWKTITKNKLILSRVKREFNGNSYAKGYIRHGKCGVVYTDTTKSGKVKMYLASHHASLAKAEKAAESKRKYGRTVLEVICNK